MTFYNKGPRTQINAFRQLYQHCVRYRRNQTFILTWFCIDSSFHDNELHQPVQHWHHHKSISKLYSRVYAVHTIKKTCTTLYILCELLQIKQIQNLLFFLFIFKRREYILSTPSFNHVEYVPLTIASKQSTFFFNCQLSWILAAENHRWILCGQYLYKSLI